MRKWIFLHLLLFSAALLRAQQSPATCWHFRSINSVGLLSGQKENALLLQTVNGASYKSWFAGIGLGLDYYSFRTLPLFLDLRKEFFKGSDKIFVYADLGISLAWVENSQKSGLINEKFTNGFYDDFGLGYKKQFGRRNALVLGIGYSYKYIRQQSDRYNFTPDWLSGFVPGPLTQSLNYSLHRLSLKMGWQF